MPRWRQLKVVIIVIVILKVTFIVIAIVISVAICHLPFFVRRLTYDSPEIQY